jgi:hypothetical protein
MRKVVAFAMTTFVFYATLARAQQEPLPPLPAPQTQPQAQPAPPPPPAPGQQQPPPAQYGQPSQSGYGQTGYGPQAPPYSSSQQTYSPPSQQVPPPAPYLPEPESRTHAPPFSLWVGGRLSFLGFSGNFYDNDWINPRTNVVEPQPETTGNFVRNGAGLEIDVGARLGKRYTPYIFFERGFVKSGHRFEDSDATAYTHFYGLGFRYTAGDVDSVGFLTDLAVGVRTVNVSRGGQTYTMSSLEIFRLGLGAEIRLSTLFALSPLAFISGGTMSDTDGSVAFSARGSGDGLTRPTYVDGRQITRRQGYLLVGIGLGGHFDVFGK